MTGLALLTSLLLGGAATSSWLFSGSATREATLAQPAGTTVSQPSPFGAFPCPPRRHAPVTRYGEGRSVLQPCAGDSLVAVDWAGNVFAETSEIGLNDLRWGVGAGVTYGSRVGPLSLEVGFRDGGASLVTFVVGWY